MYGSQISETRGFSAITICSAFCTAATSVSLSVALVAPESAIPISSLHQRGKFSGVSHLHGRLANRVHHEAAQFDYRLMGRVALGNPIDELVGRLGTVVRV